ncbi:Multi antimicrobial extrusion protein like protein [Aduncisulcus paluster]|uniref:Multi antimicrobial extrusion protein like protein n=1 Tax=Aduncisulcus paluster TaxID=2918883 RepID=A0ABQ5K2Y0_9EUKA|nr:Multi antimicrobial extrusion protein like protein [Aduncisulcus paluster]
MHSNESNASKSPIGQDDSKHSKLASESLLSLILKISLPNLVGLVLVSLYNVADSIFVGNMIGKAGLASISGYNVIEQICLYTGFSFGGSCASIISQALALQNISLAERSLLVYVILSFIFGVLMSGIQLPFLSQILSFLGCTDGEVLEGAITYGKPLAWSSTLFFLMIPPEFFFRSENKPLISMMLPLSSSLLNIIGDPLFIHFFGIKGAAFSTVTSEPLISMMLPLSSSLLNIIGDPLFIHFFGIKGAAFSTVTSEVIVLIPLIFYYCLPSSKASFKLRIRYVSSWNEIVETFKLIGKILHISIGTFAMQVIPLMSIVIQNINIKSHYDDPETWLAIISVTLRVMSLIYMPQYAFSLTLPAIAAYNVGKKNFRRVWRCVVTILLFILGISVIFCSIVEICAKFISLAFNDDPVYLEFTPNALRLSAITVSLKCIPIITTSIYQLYQKGTLGMVVGIFCCFTSVFSQLIIPKLFEYSNYSVIYAQMICYCVDAIFSSIFLISQLLFIRKQVRYENVEVYENSQEDIVGEMREIDNWWI